MRSPKIVIQLVFYQDMHFLPGLIKSLECQTFTDFYVVAVDNGEDQASARMFQELYPRGEILYGKGNIGFAGGHNLLLKRTLELEAPFVLVLNSDVELHKDFLKQLYAHIDKLPGVDACGPLIYAGVDSKRTRLVQNFRLFMNFRTARKWAPDSGKRLYSCKQVPVSADVDYLSGVAMILRTEIFSEMDFLDENLFLYGEERDFFFRFSKQNRLAMVTRKAICWHFHDWDNPAPDGLCREYYYLRRNKVLYFRKFQLTSGLMHFIARELLRIPLTLVWSLRKKNPSLFYCCWLGIWHGLRGQTGRNFKL